MTGAAVRDPAPPTVPPGAVAAWRDGVERYVRRRVQGPDADDVVQEALLRLHLKLPQLRDDAQLGPWVFRVARSAVVDHHRRRPRGAVVEADEAEEADVEPDEVSSPAREALLAAMVPLVGWLPPEQAEAVRLVDLEGRSQPEAAALLGVPLPTLKARVQRGRRRLRDAIEACCDVAVDARGRVQEMTPRGQPTSCGGCASSSS